MKHMLHNVTESSGLIAKHFLRLYPSGSETWASIRSTWMLIKTQFVCPRVSDSVSLGVRRRGARICIFKKFPDAAGMGTTFWEHLVFLILPWGRPWRMLPNNHPLFPANRVLSCSGSTERCFDSGLGIFFYLSARRWMIMGLNRRSNLSSLGHWLIWGWAVKLVQCRNLETWASAILLNFWRPWHSN